MWRGTTSAHPYSFERGGEGGRKAWRDQDGRERVRGWVRASVKKQEERVEEERRTGERNRERNRERETERECVCVCVCVCVCGGGGGSRCGERERGKRGGGGWVRAREKESILIKCVISLLQSALQRITLRRQQNYTQTTTELHSDDNRNNYHIQILHRVSLPGVKAVAQGRCQTTSGYIR